MDRNSFGDSKPHQAVEAAASRREVLKSAIALGGLTAAGTFSPGFAQQTAAPKLAAPNAFDLRNVGGKNYITSVKDQGYCNSCTAFAVVATIEGSSNFQKSHSTSGDTPGYSEAQLFFCGGPPGGCSCHAWYPEQALRFCFSPGVTDRSNNEQPQCKTPDSSWNWTKITDAVPLQDDKAIKQWISGTSPDGPGGPVIAVMVEYQDLRTFMGGESLYIPAEDTPTAINWRVGGHVVSIVGYDDAYASPGGTGNDKVWICKNSWGTQWNPSAGGYFRVKQEKGNSAWDPKHRRTYIDSFDVWGVVVA
jgi:hypothetical protein